MPVEMIYMTLVKHSIVRGVLVKVEKERSRALFLHRYH